MVGCRCTDTSKLIQIKNDNKKAVKCNCKNCKQQNGSKINDKETYPCNECNKTLENKIKGINNDCLFDAEEPPWYVRLLLSGPNKPPNFKNVFSRKMIECSFKARCKSNLCYKNYLKEIQPNSCCLNSTEKNKDPCSTFNKSKLEKSSKKTGKLTKLCKCIKKDNAQKCIGHFLIKDDKWPKPQKKNQKIANDKKWLCKNEPTTNLPSTDDSEDDFKCCQGGNERVICCTQLNETKTSKKPPKRKKRLCKKVTEDCECRNNKINSSNKRKMC